MSTALDHAVHAHMAHGAMACDDPLTECLYSELVPSPELPDPAPETVPELVPMWPELQAPGRWALVYGAVFLAVLLGSHAYARGWL